MKPLIGIIGGSGLYSMPGFTAQQEVIIETPFGPPSDAYIVGKLAGRDVAFLTRHGRGHTITPSELNFRANIYGMKKLGVEHILSLSAGGKVREFELRYRVAYRLTDLAGNDLAPPGEISLRRDLTYDDTQVLAKESEEALLYRDMKADAVQQMLRRLSVAKPVA